MNEVEQMTKEFFQSNERVWSWECTCGAEGYAAMPKFECPECNKEIWLL